MSSKDAISYMWSWPVPAGGAWEAIIISSSWRHSGSVSFPFSLSSFPETERQPQSHFLSLLCHYSSRRVLTSREADNRKLLIRDAVIVSDLFPFSPTRPKTSRAPVVSCVTGFSLSLSPSSDYNILVHYSWHPSPTPCLSSPPLLWSASSAGNKATRTTSGPKRPSTPSWRS